MTNSKRFKSRKVAILSNGRHIESAILDLFIYNYSNMSYQNY